MAKWMSQSDLQPMTSACYFSVNCGFGCIAGAQHKVKPIRHSKENTQHDCAHNCCVKKGCIGFDYNTATKDCWLSGTSWTKIPTSQAESARMTCHKASDSGKII